MYSLIYVLSMGSWPASAMIGQFFRIILATVIVAAMAYFATKLLAISKGRARSTSKGNLSVVESIAVSSTSMVQLVKAGDKYLIIGVTKEKITLLTELNSNEVVEPEIQDLSAVTEPFNKVLSKFLPKARDGQGNEDSNE